MLTLVIEAFGEKEMSRTLLRFADNAADMSVAFDEVHDEFIAAENAQFAGQGVGPSGPWAPLAPSTAAAKARLGIDSRILYGPTGNLLASLTGTGSDAIYTKSADSAFFGSNVDYGKYHQSRAARTRLPRRPLVDLTNSTKATWMKILQRHLVTGA